MSEDEGVRSKGRMRVSREDEGVRSNNPTRDEGVRDEGVRSNNPTFIIFRVKHDGMSAIVVFLPG